ncbi:sigma-70 family RNA polymerase sigma factor [Nocardiopsis suaedae]|uniref:Sigma-70 family RNA polymerase sigma factor n=1 Tax=Nocardiopsis suaedae TaxID=3018444 RepID=A0ABT4TM56_9ACTN|nr:sigma-70 family RNA polymerase sigma factor [Nocardiopsis suaedae]MDA2805788.1 sigma-70 family RNA polymerase sigma factor [Nocardiopsis suaedae]
MTETDPGPARDAGSDGALAAGLRDGGTAGTQALDELYRRHWKPVLAYALTCCRDPHTAEDLASEAFTRTLEAVRAGHGPGEAWRPYLLAVVRRTAADWAGTERRTELSDDFERWLGAAPEESGEERVLRLEDGGLVRRAFHSLPERWQAVLWHTEVEGEAAERVAPLLGIGRSGVGSLASRAREGLREAYLSAHIAGAEGECRRFAPMIGAQARRGGRRTRRDLGRHLAECERCRSAFAELSGLSRRMRTVLPAALLMWAGPFTGVAGLQTGLLAGATGGSAPLAAGAAAVGAAAVIGGAAVLGGVPAPEQGRSQDTATAAVPRAPQEPVQDPPRPPEEPVPGPTVAPDPAQQAEDDTAEEPEEEPEDDGEDGDGGGGGEEDTVRERGDDIGPRAQSARLMNAGTGACVVPEGGHVVVGYCSGEEDEVWETFAPAPGDDRTWLRNVGTGGCLGYEPEAHEGDAVSHEPCRADRQGQMFRFLMHPDGSYYLVTDAAGPQGGEFQLGVEEWSEFAPPPEEGDPLVTIYNYYDASRLRFLAAAE